MILASSSEISSSSSPMRWAREDSAALVAAVTGSVDRVGRSPLAAAMNCGVGRPLIRLWSWSGAREGQLAHLGEGLDPGLAGRPFGHHEDPDGLDGTVSGLGRCRGLSPTGRPERPRPRRSDRTCPGDAVLAVVAIDLDDLDAGSGEEPGQSGPIGPGPLHADLPDRPEAGQPREQGRIALGVAPNDSVPSRPPTSSKAAATWTSPWVSMPPVTARAASTMVMPSLPFL